MVEILTAKKLNLGCGLNHLDGYVNIDIQERVHPDLVHDISEGLPFGTSTVEEVRAHHFLEHLHRSRVIFVMTEIWRVLIPSGILDVVVPSTEGLGAFQDPTHQSFWNRNTFLYFMNDDYRRLYGVQAKFTGAVRNTARNKMGGINVVARLQAVK